MKAVGTTSLVGAAALTVCAGMAGVAAAPAASASVARATAHVAELGTATAGKKATFSLKTVHASAYALSFGDHTKTLTGKHAPAAKVTHTYGKAGWYTVTLKVTAAHARAVTSKLRILVLSPAGATASPVEVATAPASTPGVQPHTSSATVSGFSPASGTLHVPVTITGTGFTSPASATFGGVASAATVVNSTTITTSVPLGAGSGPLVVTTAGGPLTAGTFTVNAGILPTVSVGPPTSSTTIYGAGYAASEDLTYYLGGVQAATGVTTANGSFTQAVTIPAGAQPGATQLAVTGVRSGIAAASTFTVRTDWAASGFTPAETGYNPFENTIGTGNVGTLQKSFIATTAGSVLGGVAVVAGTAYFGDNSGNFYAVNATTGATIWSKSFPDSGKGGIRDTPAVANGIVYFGDQDGILRGLNATTGTLAMAYDVPDAGSFNISSPVVANGVVYIGDDDDDLYAVNATSGALVWKFAAQNQVVAGPSLSNGLVYLGSDDGSIYAVNAGTGVKAWATSVGTPDAGSLPVVNGVVYSSTIQAQGTTSVVALSASTGTTLWTSAHANTILSDLAVANGVVYFGDNNGSTYAIAAATGAAIWTVTNSTYRFNGPPAVANGVVYFPDFAEGLLFGLDATTGQQLWFADTGSQAYGQPAIVNGEVYATTYTAGGGALYAYTLGARYSPTS